MAIYLIEVRRDTAANWASVNPTLSSGEFGLETDTGKLKIGNGVTAWKVLKEFYTAKDADLTAADSVLVRYRRLVLPGSDRLNLAGNARLNLYDSLDSGMVVIPTGSLLLQYKRLTLAGSQRTTVVGTARVVLTDFAAGGATFSGAFVDLTGKPTTLAGYGIADAQPLDAELTALAGLTSAADKLPYFTGAGTATVTTLSTFVRTVLDDIDAPTFRATIGAGTSSFDGTYSSLTGTPAAFPGAYDVGTITVADGRFLNQYKRLTLSGSERLTVAGTARVLLLNFASESADTAATIVLGSPRQPPMSFVVPDTYFADVLERLVLVNAIRGTIQGTGRLYLTDDFNTRSRVVLAGRG